MIRTRNEVPKEECWNVEAFYPTLQKWQNDLESAEGTKKFPRWPDLGSYKGTLKDSPEAVARFFDAYFGLQRQLYKLHTYAHLRLDEDLGNDSLKKNFGLITSLIHDFQLEFSWVEPELLSLGDDEFKKIIENPLLQEYRFYLEKIGRMRPHILTREMEELIAMGGKALETPYKVFGVLNNADLTFAPATTKGGEKRELTAGTYLLYLRDEDRQLRKSAFEELHRGYQKYANTFCELIQGQVQSHLFVAKARNFKDCREAALFPFAVEGSVYDMLIDVINRNLPSLQFYIGLRKKLLKLDELHPYDLAVSLVPELQMKKSFSEACELVVESVAPLGAEYQQTLKKGLLEEGWVDPFENKSKRSGAYSSGCYDSMPYILMNYHGTFQDILTLAHEAGHSMHSYLSRKNQPYVYASYPIFVAEVASTFNEQLLLNLLKKRAKTNRERAYYICTEIEGIRTTIFRQTLFAEFELLIHRFAEQGVPLTPSLLKDAYLELNRKYYGSELILDAGIEAECFRIPHFYYDFYVYQYATGLSAAIDLYERCMASHEARDRYLQFLKSGGSRYPLDLLQLAGIDLRKSKTIEAAMRRFVLLVDEFQKLL